MSQTKFFRNCRDCDEVLTWCAELSKAQICLHEREPYTDGKPGKIENHTLRDQISGQRNITL